jgi:shikimate kinase
MFLNELFSNSIHEGIHDPGLYKAVFMAGPPGAGKNLIIHTLGLNSYGLKMMDSDEVITFLNKETEQLPVNDVGYKQATSILNRRQTIYKNEMLGLIINTTGRDYEQTINLKKSLENAGYDTFMVFVGVEKEIAKQRIKDRETSATDIRDMRPVEKKYFNKAYRDCNRNMLFYSMMFENNFAFINNSIDYGPRDVRGNVIDPEQKRLLFNNIKSVRQQVVSFLNQPTRPVEQKV